MTAEDREEFEAEIAGLRKRAERLRLYAGTGPVGLARVRGKAQAYRHAAELLEGLLGRLDQG